MKSMPRKKTKSDMSVHVIGIPPSMKAELKLNKYHYPNKQAAVDAFTEICQERGIKFRVEVRGIRTVFLNEAGGILAEIEPVQTRTPTPASSF